MNPMIFLLLFLMPIFQSGSINTFSSEKTEVLKLSTKTSFAVSIKDQLANWAAPLEMTKISKEIFMDTAIQINPNFFYKRTECTNPTTSDIKIALFSGGSIAKSDLPIRFKEFQLIDKSGGAFYLQSMEVQVSGKRSRFIDFGKLNISDFGQRLRSEQFQFEWLIKDITKSDRIILSKLTFSNGLRTITFKDGIFFDIT